MTDLTGVSIRRFKGVKSLDLELAPVNVLIGANNAGKSSVLQAIHFGATLAQSMALAGGEWKYDKLAVSLSEGELLYQPVAEVEALAHDRNFTQNPEHRVEIAYRFSDGGQTKVSFARGKNRNLSSTVEGKAKGQEISDWQQPVTVFVPGLAGIQREEEYLAPAVVRRFAARGDANLVLRNILFLLKKNAAKWDMFVAEMQRIFPGLQLAINFDMDKDTRIDVRVQFGSGPSLPIDAAGTSVLQLCQLVSYTYLFNPKILILDEPDSHVHPGNQRKLAHICVRLAEEFGMRIVVSTHSRHLLDAFRGQAQTLWLAHGKLQQATDQEKDVLLGLGALDSMDYFASGGKRVVILTEDTEKQPLRALLNSNGFVMSQTEVVSYSGCTKLDSAIVLGKFLKDHATGLKVIVHRDRDYVTQDSHDLLRTNLGHHGLELFLTPGTDVEAAFCTPEHLATVNTQYDIAHFKTLIDKAVPLVKNASIAKAVNSRLDEERRKKIAGHQCHPDSGALAVEVHSAYEAEPIRMTHGKTLQSTLRRMHQEEKQTALVIHAPSAHLQLPSLEAISAAVWPQAPTGTPAVAPAELAIPAAGIMKPPVAATISPVTPAGGPEITPAPAPSIPPPPGPSAGDSNP